VASNLHAIACAPFKNFDKENNLITVHILRSDLMCLKT